MHVNIFLLIMLCQNRCHHHQHLFHHHRRRRRPPPHQQVPHILRYQFIHSIMRRILCAVVLFQSIEIREQEVFVAAPIATIRHQQWIG
jgi:hypothetical protein